MLSGEVDKGREFRRVEDWRLLLVEIIEIFHSDKNNLFNNIFLYSITVQFVLLFIIYKEGKNYDSISQFVYTE